MDVINSHHACGSLHISSDVIKKIATQACMEVEGVKAVAYAASAGKTIIDKLSPPNPIQVDIKDDVAEIEVSLLVKYGTKIPELSERVQQNVKNSVQNMTSITVGQVNVLITGVTLPE